MGLTRHAIAVPPAHLTRLRAGEPGGARRRERKRARSEELLPGELEHATVLPHRNDIAEGEPGRADAPELLREPLVDAHTTKFGASVLAESGGDRKSPFFRRFFTVAPSAFFRQPLRKQCELTLHVMAAEIGKLDKHHPLKAFASSLTGLATQALTALDVRTKAKAERAVASNDVDEWKEGVNTLRLSTYAELLKIAADKDYGKAWVEAFFRVETTGGADEEAPAPAPSPGNANAGSAITPANA